MRREAPHRTAGTGRQRWSPAMLRALDSLRAGDLAEAERSCRRALGRRANDPAALHLLGAIAARRGAYARAAGLLARSIRADASDAEAHRNLGTCLLKLGRIDEAITALRDSLALRPEDAAALNNLGNALLRKAAYEEAAKCYQRAVILAPSSADLRCNLGDALCALGRHDEAIESLQRALDTDPARIDTLAQLIHACLHVCRWERLAELSARADALLPPALERDDEAIERPFLNIARCDDPALNLAVARRFCRRLTRDVVRTASPPTRRRRPRARIAIGYLSTGFRRHPGGFLMRRVFGLHDRDGFRIHAYSAGSDDGSEIRRDIAQGCDAFIDVRGLDPAAIARRIAEDGIDVLVERDGHTTGSRLAACAFRPAPIVASYLGFPGTTGAAFVDYLLADRVVAPPEHAAFYSEKLVYLPHCYQANDDRPPVATSPSRPEVGLPDDGPVLCCFNQLFKLEPVMFGIWMRVLRQLPRAVLWLGPAPEPARANLRREAADRGVLPERLVFAERRPREEHLARIALADLALDTRVYNGHTTTSEALWAGVPVVTMLGRHFASRVSASLLTAVGLPELVTHSLEAYEALVLRLAAEPDSLAALRHRLATRRDSSPLFDTTQFVRGLERAYRRMVEIHDAGEPPRAIDLTACG